jgi:exosome complex RNA-binding protein Rrp4
MEEMMVDRSPRQPLNILPDMVSLTAPTLETEDQASYLRFRSETVKQIKSGSIVSLLPERVERVLPKRHGKVTFCTI